MKGSIDRLTITTIWWIRRDLRLHDNPALHAALENSDAIIPLFIMDPKFERSAFVGENRLAFLYANLSRLDQELRQRGGRLIVRQGEPATVLAQVFRQTDVRTIYAQEDFSPYAVERDTSVAHQLPLYSLPD